MPNKKGNYECCGFSECADEIGKTRIVRSLESIIFKLDHGMTETQAAVFYGMTDFNEPPNS